MQMTSSEIVSSYRQSLNHREQITILADLNSCAPATIVEVLKQAGVELPSGFKPPKYHPIPQAQYRIDELRAMELYKDGLSDRDIAEQLGCTRTGVANWRKRMHLKAHYPKRTPRKPGQMSLPGSPKEETPPDAVVVPLSPTQMSGTMPFLTTICRPLTCRFWPTFCAPWPTPLRAPLS